MNPLSMWTAMTFSGPSAALSKAVHTALSTPPLTSDWRIIFNRCITLQFICFYLRYNYTHQHISIANLLTNHLNTRLLSVHQCIVTMATTYLQVIVSNFIYDITSHYLPKSHTQVYLHSIQQPQGIHTHTINFIIP